MIGLFDSGSGGISVLTAIRRVAPQADIVYFGDIAHAPYGGRSADELSHLTQKGVELLRKEGANELVSACNSVSYAVLAGAAGQMRVIEMSRPLAHAMRSRAGGRVLVLATPATIQSELYQSALQGIVAIDTLPIPELAGAIEFQRPHEEIREIIRATFATRSGQSYDALVLGCTHYPLVADIISEEASRAFDFATIIDPAESVAEAVREQFDIAGQGATRFFISHDSHAFRNRISPFFLEGACELTVI